MNWVLLMILPVLLAHEIRDDLKSHPNWHLLNRDDDCGQSFIDRIIGGHQAVLGQFPWIARLGYTSVFDTTKSFVAGYECGGTIISSRYILTAAHCNFTANKLKLIMIQVRVGEHDTQTDPDCESGVCAPKVQDIAVESFYCHQHYTNITHHNDICLVRLSKPIEFNDYVSPICLPVYDTFLGAAFDKTIMDVAGWGITEIADPQPSRFLLSLKVPIVNNHLCAKKYRGRAVITDNQICAGGVIGKDSCTGDSGGPLMRAYSMNAPPRYFLIGVVSFGPENCAATNTPGVYTRVAEYMPWILDHIRP